MKKLLALLFLALLLFTSCKEEVKPKEVENLTETETHTKTDTWDGNIATSFSSGEGTKDNPYIIAKCSELALLAQKVNCGENFKGKFFEITNDLDLNSIEWTPIGTNEYPFNASVNANGHIISNIRITKPSSYALRFDYNNKTSITFYAVAGLFGVCSDVFLSNINIKNATVSAETLEKADVLYMGGLIAYLKDGEESALTNIKVTETKILSKKKIMASTTISYLGGIIGCIRDASCKMEKIHSDTYIESCEKAVNYIGSISGSVSGSYKDDILLECANASLYTNIKFFTESSENYVGAFGYISIGSGKIKLSDIFSLISSKNINNYENTHFYKTQAGAIIGDLFYNQNTKTELEFKNLFGYVKSLTTYGNIYDTLVEYSLYEKSKYATFNETNCAYTETLPDNHGFDLEIWDVTDKKKPKLR